MPSKALGYGTESHNSFKFALLLTELRIGHLANVIFLGIGRIRLHFG